MIKKKIIAGIIVASILGSIGTGTTTGILLNNKAKKNKHDYNLLLEETKKLSKLIMNDVERNQAQEKLDEPSFQHYSNNNWYSLIELSNHLKSLLSSETELIVSELNKVSIELTKYTLSEELKKAENYLQRENILSNTKKLISVIKNLDYNLEKIEISWLLNALKNQNKLKNLDFNLSTKYSADDLIEFKNKIDSELVSLDSSLLINLKKEALTLKIIESQRRGFINDKQKENLIKTLNDINNFSSFIFAEITINEEITKLKDIFKQSKLREEAEEAVGLLLDGETKDNYISILNDPKLSDNEWNLIVNSVKKIIEDLKNDVNQKIQRIKNNLIKNELSEKLKNARSQKIILEIKSQAIEQNNIERNEWIEKIKNLIAKLSDSNLDKNKFTQMLESELEDNKLSEIEDSIILYLKNLKEKVLIDIKIAFGHESFDELVNSANLPDLTEDQLLEISNRAILLYNNRKNEIISSYENIKANGEGYVNLINEINDSPNVAILNILDKKVKALELINLLRNEDNKNALLIRLENVINNDSDARIRIDEIIDDAKKAKAIEDANGIEQIRLLGFRIPYPGGSNVPAILEIIERIDQIKSNESLENEEKLRLVNEIKNTYYALEDKVNFAINEIIKLSPENQNLLNEQLNRTNLISNNSINSNVEFDNLFNAISSAKNSEKESAKNIIRNLTSLDTSAKQVEINKIDDPKTNTFSKIQDIVEKARFNDQKKALELKAKAISYKMGITAQGIQDIIQRINATGDNAIDTLDKIESFSNEISRINSRILALNSKYDEILNPSSELTRLVNSADTNEEFENLNSLLERTLEEQRLADKKSKLDAQVNALDYPDSNGNEVTGDNDAPAITRIKEIYANNSEQQMDIVINDLQRIKDSIANAKTELLKVSSKNKRNFSDGSTNSNSINLYNELRNAYTAQEFSDLITKVNAALEKDKVEAKQAVDNLLDLAEAKKTNFKNQIIDSENFLRIEQIISASKLADKKDKLRKIIVKSDYYNSDVALSSEINQKIDSSLEIISSNIENTNESDLSLKETKLNSLKSKLNEVRDLINNLSSNDVINLESSKLKLFNLLSSKTSIDDIELIKIEIEKEKLKRESKNLLYPGKNESEDVVAVTDLFRRIERIDSNVSLETFKRDLSSLPNKISEALNSIDSINSNVSTEENNRRKQILKDELNRADTSEEFETLRRNIENARNKSIEEFRNSELQRLRSRADQLPYPQGSNAQAINDIKALITSDVNIAEMDSKITSINNEILNAISRINKLSSENQNLLNTQLNNASTDQNFRDLNSTIDSKVNEEKNRILTEINNLEFLTRSRKDNYISQLNNKSFEELTQLLKRAKIEDLETAINNLPYPNTAASAKASLLSSISSLSDDQSITNKLNEIKLLKIAIQNSLRQINSIPYPSGQNANGASQLKNRLNSLTDKTAIENVAPTGLSERIQKYKDILNTNLNPFPSDSREYGLKTRINNLSSINSVDENILKWNLYETKRRHTFVPLIDRLDSLNPTQKASLKNEAISIRDELKEQNFDNFDVEIAKLDTIILKAQKENAKAHIDSIEYPSTNESAQVRNSLKQAIDNARDITEINSKKTENQRIKERMHSVVNSIRDIHNDNALRRLRNILNNIDHIDDFNNIELEIQKARAVDYLTSLAYLTSEQVNDFSRNINSSNSNSEIERIKLNANLQNEREKVKRLVDLIPYPNKDLSDASNVISKIKSEIDNLSSDELNNKQNELTSFKNLMSAKISEVDSLPYHETNATAKRELKNLFNTAENESDLNRILPSSWSNQINTYKRIISSHFPNTSDLFAKLDLTHPTKENNYSVNQLNNEILKAKKLIINNVIKNLKTLSPEDKERFTNQVNQIGNNHDGVLLNDDYLVAIDNVLIDTNKVNFNTLIDSFAYPEDSNLANNVSQSKSEIKQALVNSISSLNGFAQLEGRLNSIKEKINTINTKLNQIVDNNKKNYFKNLLSLANHTELQGVESEIDKYLEVFDQIKLLTVIENNSSDADEVNSSIISLRNSLIQKANNTNSEASLRTLLGLIKNIKVALDFAKQKFTENPNNTLLIKGIAQELSGASNANEVNVIKEKVLPIFNEIQTWWNQSNLNEFIDNNKNYILTESNRFKSYAELLRELKTQTTADGIRNILQKMPLYRAMIEFSKKDKTEIPQVAINSFTSRVLSSDTPSVINQVSSDLDQYLSIIRLTRVALDSFGESTNRSEMNSLINQAADIAKINELKTKVNEFKDSYLLTKRAYDDYVSTTDYDPNIASGYLRELNFVQNKESADLLRLKIRKGIVNIFLNKLPNGNSEKSEIQRNLESAQNEETVERIKEDVVLKLFSLDQAKNEAKNIVDNIPFPNETATEQQNKNTSVSILKNQIDNASDVNELNVLKQNNQNLSIAVGRAVAEINKLSNSNNVKVRLRELLASETSETNANSLILRAKREKVIEFLSTLTYLSTSQRNGFIDRINASDESGFESIKNEANIQNKKEEIKSVITSIGYPSSTASAKTNLTNSVQGINNLPELENKLREIRELKTSVEAALQQINQLPYPDGRSAAGATSLLNRLNGVVSQNQIENLNLVELSSRIQNYKDILNTPLNPFPSEPREYGLKTRINNFSTINSEDENILMWNLYETKRQGTLNPIIDRLDLLSGDQKTSLKAEAETIPESRKTQPINDFNAKIANLDAVILKAQKENAKVHVDSIGYPSQNNSSTARNTLKQAIDASLNLNQINSKRLENERIKQRIAEVVASISNINDQQALSNVNNLLDQVDNIDDFDAINFEIIKARAIDYLATLSLENSDLNSFRSRINQAQNEETINRIKEEANIQGKKDEVKRIIDTISYPNNNSTSLNSKNTLKQEVQELRTISDVENKRNTIIAFKSHLESKITEASSLNYPGGNNVIAINGIKSALDSTTNIESINQILPENWASKLNQYRTLINSHIETKDSILQKLNQIYPTGERENSVQTFDNDILTSKKNEVIQKVNQLNLLTDLERRNFISNIEDVSNIGQNLLPNPNKLNDIDNIYINAIRSSLSKLPRGNNKRTQLEQRLNSTTQYSRLQEIKNEMDNEKSQLDSKRREAEAAVNLLSEGPIKSGLLSELASEEHSNEVSKLESIKVRAQNNRTLNDRKNVLKALVATIDYPNRNAPAITTLNNEIDRLSTTDELDQKEEQINALKRAMDGKRALLDSLIYRSNSEGNASKTAIRNELNNVTDASRVEVILPSTWASTLTLYKNLIVGHFGASSGLLYRLDKTRPITFENFTVQELNNQILATKQVQINSKLEGLTLLTSSERTSFTERVNGVTIDDVNPLPSGVKLQSIDHIYIEAVRATIEKLPEGNNKRNELNNRLTNNSNNTEIEAIKAELSAEKTALDQARNLARASIERLEDGNVKTELLRDLDNISLTNEVTKLEEIKNRANNEKAIQDKKVSLKNLVDRIAYPSETAQAKSTLKTSIDNLTSIQDLDNKEIEIQALLQAMSNKAEIANNLSYRNNDNGNAAKQTIIRLLNEATTAERVNQVLPESWPNDLIAYSNLITTHWDANHGLFARLDQTRPDRNDDYSISQLEHQILETKKANFRDKVNGVPLLENSEKAEFIGRINAISNIGPNRLPAPDKLEEIDSIFLDSLRALARKLPEGNAKRIDIESRISNNPNSSAIEAIKQEVVTEKRNLDTKRSEATQAVEAMQNSSLKTQLQAELNNNSQSNEVDKLQGIKDRALNSASIETKKETLKQLIRSIQFPDNNAPAINTLISQVESLNSFDSLNTKEEQINALKTAMSGKRDAVNSLSYRRNRDGNASRSAIRNALNRATTAERVNQVLPASWQSELSSYYNLISSQFGRNHGLLVRVDKTQPEITNDFSINELILQTLATKRNPLVTRINALSVLTQEEIANYVSRLNAINNTGNNILPAPNQLQEMDSIYNEALRAAVNKLPSGNAKKANLETRIRNNLNDNQFQALKNELVNEKTSLDTKRNQAQDLINELSDGTEKTNLQNELNDNERSNEIPKLDSIISRAQTIKSIKEKKDSLKATVRRIDFPNGSNARAATTLINEIDSLNTLELLNSKETIINELESAMSGKPAIARSLAYRNTDNGRESKNIIIRLLNEATTAAAVNNALPQNWAADLEAYNRIITAHFGASHGLLARLDQTRPERTDDFSIAQLEYQVLETKKVTRNNEIRAMNHLSDEQKNAIYAQINSIQNVEPNKLPNDAKLVEIDNIFNAVRNDRELEQLKAQLISAISGWQIESEISKILISIVRSHTDITAFREFKSKLETMNTAFNSLVATKNQVQNRLAPSNTNGTKVLNFNKELVKYTKLSKDNKLAKINYNNIQDTINEINNLKNSLERLGNAANSNSQKTWSQLMLEETENVFNLETTESARAYNLSEFENAGSFNFKNSKLLFDHYDNDTYDFEISGLTLTGNNLETLNVTVDVYLKSDRTKKVTFTKRKTFSQGAKAKLDAINLSNLDQVFDVDYDLINSYTQAEWNNLSIEEQGKAFKKNKPGLNNYFNYEIKRKSSLSGNKIRPSVEILFNNQTVRVIDLSSNNNITFRNSNETREAYWDRINLEKVRNIINNTNEGQRRELFFKNISFKNLNNMEVHNDYVVTDVIDKFNNLYNLPTFGRYQIFLKDYFNVDHANGRADFTLWYKIDGVEASGYNFEQRKSKKVNIGGFNAQNFYDIRPKGTHFAAEDFKSNEFREPGQDIKTLADSINESNFEWKYATGQFWGWNNRSNRKFRTLNAKTFMDQQAYLRFEYFMTLVNGKNSKGTNRVNDEYDPIGANQVLYDKEITVNPTNINKLKEQFYRYYYDFRLEDDRSLSFRIGYIQKTNNSVRYTNDKRFTLINLVNDFEQTLYPEIMVNNIKMSDIEINTQELATHTIEWYKNNMGTLREHIKVRGDERNRVVYKNFWMNRDSFNVHEIKRINENEAYIRFNTRTLYTANNWNAIGDTWYRISGFKSDSTKTNKEDLSFRDNNLETVFESTTEIKRKRIIEPYWKDLLWKLDEDNNVASWTLDKKYIDKTLLQENTKDRQITVKIFGNMLFNDGDKNNRIRNEDQVISINIDLNELIKHKAIKTEFTSPNLEGNQFRYNVIAEWTDVGIAFKVYTEDSSYKIILDEPEVQSFSSGTKFDRNRALIILPAASKIYISYTNNREHENFGIESNKFDYNEVEYTEFQEPILFSNDLSFLKDKTVYYPNQNVHYKLHEGFKMNIEQMRKEKQKDWDLVKVALSRSLVDDQNTSFGTVSIIGKVNNDPNDYKFYVSTNKHVQSVSNWNEISGNNFLKEVRNKKYSFAPVGSLFQPSTWINTGSGWIRPTNDILRTHNYRDSHLNKIERKTINIIWSGVSQKDKNGNEVGNGQVDFTVYVIDLKDDYLRAKRDGSMTIVWRIENLMKNPNVKLEADYKQGFMSVPNIREISNVSWPNIRYAGQIFRRFSKNQYISAQNSRTNFSDAWIVWQQQHFYSQYFGGGGASGSGLFFEDGTYAGAWNSGSAGNNDGYWSQGPRYGTRSHNYFGVNFDGEDPLSLKNTNSLGAQIVRANLRNPIEFDLPWFFKEKKQK
nr:hypothetical protein [Mycoplasmopsis canis]WQQ12565.1 hypothetical protein RRG48_00775 [Mycoplasmopsis canis]